MQSLIAAAAAVILIHGLRTQKAYNHPVDQAQLARHHYGLLMATANIKTQRCQITVLGVKC
jgi:hypothetical protein